jgi:nucleotide-binding universal stress UspA family protein
MVTEQDVHGRHEFRIAVVGVDGSEESLSALRWAARAVGSEGVVHAVSALSPGLELAVAAVQYDSAKLVEHRTRELETEWVIGIGENGCAVECRVIEDDPADALRRTADDVDADLIVVGVHTKPPLAPRTVGRVTAKLIRDTTRPLVIVEDGAELEVGASNVVAVGAGYGEATHSALRWAGEFAEHNGMAVSLLRAIPARPIIGTDGLIDAMAFYVDRELLREWAYEDLEALADEIQRSTVSELRISITASTGAPGPRLVEEGADANLIVVGRHAGANRTLPAPLRHVITHAPCPIVIVPATDGRA